MESTTAIYWCPSEFTGQAAIFNQTNNPCQPIRGLSYLINSQKIVRANNANRNYSKNSPICINPLTLFSLRASPYFSLLSFSGNLVTKPKTILFVDQFSRKNSRCDSYSNGKERREWTHACMIVGRVYFLARFSRSHLPFG